MSEETPTPSVVEEVNPVLAPVKKTRKKPRTSSPISAGPAGSSLAEVLEKKIPSSSPRLVEVQGILDNQMGVEEKIRKCLDAMSASLSGEGSPHFREFWQVKQLCLPLFKEAIAPKVRAELWSSYIELSVEAKRVKAILDEQSAFAAEQIELALQAIERDVGLQEALLAQTSLNISIASCISLQNNRSQYEELQRKLQLLNQIALRLSSLRKEVLQTEMRIRIKNQFLSRLSLCCDLVFPQRRSLIQQVSLLFEGDVARFISEHLQKEELAKIPFHQLREEIKELQAIAKQLFLTTPAFMKTRLELSQAWDLIKEKEKEKRADLTEKKETYRQNFQLIAGKIAPFKVACQEGELSEEECHLKAQEILKMMKGFELGKEEMALLRKEVAESKNLVLDREREKLIQKKRVLDEEEGKRKGEVIKLQNQLTAHLSSQNEKSAAELSQILEEMVEKSKALSSDQEETRAIHRALKELKEILHAKKMNELLQLPKEGEMAIEPFKQALLEYEARKQELKKEIDEHRKVLGSSGLDFEKAMLYRDLVQEGKNKLEKIEEEIEKIEEEIEKIVDKIDELQGE